MSAKVESVVTNQGQGHEGRNRMTSEERKHIKELISKASPESSPSGVDSILNTVRGGLELTYAVLVFAAGALELYRRVEKGSGQSKLKKRKGDDFA